jgi:hypothetical protein
VTAAVYQPKARAAEPSPQARRTRAERTEATIKANAQVVFQGYRAWRFCHRKSDNHPFFMIDGSPVRQPDGTERRPTYYVDLHSCDCPSHRDGRVACKHMRAVRLWFEAVKQGEIVVPRRMTRADTALLTAAAAVAGELDIAESADALLDAYQAQQRQQRSDRWAGPEQAWWQRDDGGIVWLQEGDRVYPDTAPEVPPSVTEPADPALRCRALHCADDDVDVDGFCPRHALVDAF